MVQQIFVCLSQNNQNRQFRVIQVNLVSCPDSNIQCQPACWLQNHHICWPINGKNPKPCCLSGGAPIRIRNHPATIFLLARPVYFRASGAASGAWPETGHFELGHARLHPMAIKHCTGKSLELSCTWKMRSGCL